MGKCHALIWSTYDVNMYRGKEEPRYLDTTLGEAVVTKLSSTIRGYNVSLCFDRLFTSSRFINEIKCVSWKVKKDVAVLSNCHRKAITIVGRKAKYGSNREFPCLEAIQYYNILKHYT